MILPLKESGSACSFSKRTDLSALSAIPGEMAYVQPWKKSTKLNRTAIIFIDGHLFFFQWARFAGRDIGASFVQQSLFCFARNLFPDVVGKVQSAKIELPKLFREQVDLVAVLKVPVDNDPAVFHDSA